VADEASAEEVSTDEAPAEEAPAPLTATLSAQIVEFVTDADGNLVERLTDGTVAVPGDIIQYTAVYENISEAPLIGLIVNGPVPASTGYLGGSESINVDATFEVLIEGEEWQGLPAFKTVVDETGEAQRVEATPADYLQVRWRLDGALDPETAVTAIYRVAVDS
jgi:uncharacterized repeat protein (TIGR01451 family)